MDNTKRNFEMPCVVASAEKDIVLENVFGELIGKVLALDARVYDYKNVDENISGKYCIPYRDVEHEIELYRILRDLGFAFRHCYRSGWSPADIFEYRRERGDLSGKYTCIYWRAEIGEYEIEEK